MQLLTTIRETAQDFRKLLTDLIEAIKINTRSADATHTALVVLAELAAKNVEQTAAVREAVQYLELAERHKREQSGQRSEFGGSRG